MILTSDDFPCQRKFTQMSDTIKQFQADTALIRETLVQEIAKSQECVTRLEKTLEERNKAANEAASDFEQQLERFDLEFRDGQEVIYEL